MSENDIVAIIDDDDAVRKSIERLMRAAGLRVHGFASAEDFLHFKTESDPPSCLILDIYLPGTSGLDLQCKLNEMKVDIPIVFISGHADVPVSVEAMKGGALDFLQKPYRTRSLLDAVKNAIEHNRQIQERVTELKTLRDRYERLTPRERDVMVLVVSGLMNKEVASQLGTTEKTIKFHRHHVMEKMQARSIAELVRYAEKLSIP